MKKLLTALFFFAFLMAVSPLISQVDTGGATTETPTIGEGKPIIPETTTGPGMTILVVYLGFILFFVIRYRGLKMANPALVFSWRIWWKDNWYNVTLFTGGIVWLLLTGKIGKSNTMMAFMVGMSPNTIIDFVGAAIEKLSMGAQNYVAKYKRASLPEVPPSE